MELGRRAVLRRRRRGLSAALVAVAALLALFVAATGPGVTQAAFTATTSNPANTPAADRLAPPGPLPVTVSCGAAAAPIAFRGSSTAWGWTR